MLRYAYIKNGDVVEQIQRIIRTENIITSGPDAFIYDFLNYIGRKEVLLISCHNQTSEYRKGNIEANVFKYSSEILWPVGSLFYRLIAFIQTLRKLIKFRPQRIICGRNGALLWATYIYSIFRSIPYIHSRHNTLKGKKISLIKIVSSNFDIWCIKKAQGIICHGPYIKKQFIDSNIRPEKVFEFDISFRDIEKHKNHNKIENRKVGEGKNDIILYLGRIEQQKGVYDLLSACDEILKTYNNAFLVYAGEGSQKDHLIRMVHKKGLKKKVKILCQIKHENVGDIIKSAKMVITPTKGIVDSTGKVNAEEARCMTAMESLFCGVPVICPDSGPFPYLVSHEINGMLFKTNSIESLKKNIIKLLDNENFYFNIRENTKKSSRMLKIPLRTFSEAVREAFLKK